MYRYDPLRDVDPVAWKALEEGGQQDAVAHAHRKVPMGEANPRMHAVLHVIVENQILLGAETPVAAAMKRLSLEGLDRHEAVHAVAGVLAWHMREVMAGNRTGTDVYFREIEALTADKWREGARDE